MLELDHIVHYTEDPEGAAEKFDRDMYQESPVLVVKFLSE